VNWVDKERREKDKEDIFIITDYYKSFKWMHSKNEVVRPNTMSSYLKAQSYH
jgi:hypothetical protein